MEWKQLLNSMRVRPSTSPGDHRSEFEKDFGRVVFSTPVKRLQDKTQVFPLEQHDAVRTRLTHSLEVSSVARGIAIAVTAWLNEKNLIQRGMDRQIEVIAETCGLIHDLGNPPFGHAGEEAIRGWFRDIIGEDCLKKHFDGRPQLIQDFLKFDGNAQTLRLVTRLQLLADFNGLNFTFGTLSALCKYTAPSHEAGLTDDPTRSKTGYFASESKLVKQIREATGTGDARNPIAFIVEAADDIVYSAADIEDAVKKGVFTWKYLEELLKDPDNVAQDALARKDLILKAGGPDVPPGLEDDLHASAFRTAAIGIMVASVIETFKNRYDAIMDGSYREELVRDGAASPLIDLLKKIGREHVYSTSSTLKIELMGRNIIHDLLDLFWEGAELLPRVGSPKTIDFPGRLGSLLSENYRRVFQEFVARMTELPESYHRFQLVTDYVCGMTDSFAKRLHAELTNA